MKRILIPALAICSAVATSAEPTAEAVLRDMKRAADWQIANPSTHSVHDWTQAPFFLGLYNLFQVSGDAKYREALDGFGKQVGYGPGPRVTHADDHAVLQAWLELHRIDHDYAKLRPAIAHFDKVRAELRNEEPKSLSGGTFTWCWCDALFMSPAVWVQLSDLTGNPKFLEWADREWWTTTDVLYDPESHLFYRDNRFFGKKTESGHKVFWSRGNGWVVGGLVHILDRLPADHPSRQRYLGLYHDMMHALVKLQNPDGLWRTSLLEPNGPAGESSGSSFFVYAMAWGLNRGLLPEKTFRPVVMKGWQALAGNIQPDGMLGFVQKISDKPEPAARESTEVYGTGALLLAGAEIVRMFDPTKRRTDLAKFEGVELKEPYLRSEPRVYARFVPERQDDFAWENDMVAFRTYGPALRAGAEDSGIDVWFKRVPYPILDKWYIEDVTPTKHTNKPKSYHADQGEGYDAYKVGNTRGVGGISLWTDGQLHNSDTYVGHRILENTPEKAVFELDYASRLDDKVVRETKRITLLMGQQVFQCESRFIIDGKSGPFEVAIGLKPQGKGKGVFHPEQGWMSVWEKVDGLGLGQGVVIDPRSVVKMMSHTDGEGQTQHLCLARTDDTGSIRWLAGYAWEGRGVITTEKAWIDYLGTCTKDGRPYKASSTPVEVHRLDPPADLPKPPAEGAALPRPKLQIINGSKEPVDVFWIKDGGERVKNGSVKPGEDSIIDTTLGHRFAVVGRQSAKEVVAVSEVPIQAIRFDPEGRDGIPAFYTQRVDVRGFPIVASAKVNPFAPREAAFIVDKMLAKRPDVLTAMVKSGARLCIMAHDEFTTDLPEFERLASDAPEEALNLNAKEFWDSRARGLGGSETDPYCSCAEENVLGYPGDPYEKECILIHEFAHNIHLRGLMNIDPTFDLRLQETYDSAMKAGLWKGKYASVNSREYFAEGVQSWFDDNRENDHDHNHVNTRAELLEYDPGLAALCREVFGDTQLTYTKPATRIHGHMKGYDPSKAPAFVWPGNLEAVKAQVRAAAEKRKQK